MQGFRRWVPMLTGAYVLALILYTALRAARIPFTYDEAYSFLHYACMKPREIMFAPAAFDLANNHVLNTLLLKALSGISTHPFVLRLPGLVAACLFLYSIYRIAALLFEDRVMRLLLLITVSFNPMLPEFFALARGYGMGIGLLSYALLQLMLVTACPGAGIRRSLRVQAGCLAGLLAAYSSFSFLLPVVLLFLLMAVGGFVIGPGPLGRRLFHASQPMVYGLILYLLVRRPIGYLLAAGALFHGGHRNFVADTWSSMISDLTGARPHAFTAFEDGTGISPALPLWTVVSLALLGLALLLTVLYLRRAAADRNAWAAVLPAVLLAGCIGGVNLQFYLQGTLFINYRVALYLYPLLGLTLFAALKYLPAAGARSVAVILALLLALNGLPQLQLRYTTEWPFDAYNRQVSDYINTHAGAAPKLAAYHLMAPSLQFYTATQHDGGGTWKSLDEAAVKQDTTAYDYLYFPKARDGNIPAGYAAVQAYEDSTYLLFRRK